MNKERLISNIEASNLSKEDKEELITVETESPERVYKTNNKVNGGGQRVLGLSPCNK